MGKYKISVVSSVTFDKYHDVLRVIANKKHGFWASLVSSVSETYFILSEESPLAKELRKRTDGQCIWNFDESKFRSMTLNGKVYYVELEIDKYESAKAQKREKERIEREKKEAAVIKLKEEERRLKETIDNAATYKIPFSSLRLVVDEKDSFSNQMAAIAGNANMAFLQKDSAGFQKSIIELYNKVHGYNSHKLKTIAAKDGQCIGLAFIKMAMYFSNGDFQVNEIAAQNAFYCIVKDFKNSGNTYALPALFSLFLKKPKTLEDELYRANPDPELVGLGGMTPSAPYMRSDKAMSNRLAIMKFLLQKFYNEGQKRFTIDTTLPYHLPSEADVVNFISEFKKSEYASKTDAISVGESFFNDVYDDIEEQLNL